MNKAILSLSGGADSATLLGYVMEGGNFDEVRCVSFQYGSKHNAYEREAAAAVAAYYKVSITTMDLRPVFESFRSSLLQDQGRIPEGHYTDESMRSTVVPARNMIFISILTGLAISNKCSTVFIGVHSGDHAIYPDCRPTFIVSEENTVFQASDGQVGLRAPFLNMTKGDIIKMGLSFGVPYALTRTCYKQQEIACGKCGACVERLEAFEESGSRDPIPYEVSR